MTTENNEKSVVEALVYNFLKEKKSSALAKFFHKEMEAAVPLSEGSPSLLDIVNHYQKTSAKKLSLKSISEEEFSSSDTCSSCSCDCSSCESDSKSSSDEPAVRTRPRVTKANKQQKPVTTSQKKTVDDSDESSSEDDQLRKYLSKTSTSLKMLIIPTRQQPKERRKKEESSSEEDKKPSKKKPRVTTSVKTTPDEVQKKKEFVKVSLKVAALRSEQHIKLHSTKEELSVKSSSDVTLKIAAWRKQRSASARKVSVE